MAVRVQRQAFGRRLCPRYDTFALVVRSGLNYTDRLSACCCRADCSLLSNGQIAESTRLQRQCTLKQADSLPSAAQWPASRMLLLVMLSATVSLLLEKQKREESSKGKGIEEKQG